MKFITLKDIHFRFGFETPRGRTETFFDEINAKLEQIAQLKQQHNIDGLILTGDIVDKSSGYTLAQVKANEEAFRKLKDTFGIVYSICGNHDTLWASADYKKDSVYQLLVDIGYITDLDGNPKQIGNYTLAGIDYANKETTLKKLIELDKSHENLILVLHQHLVPNEADKLPYECFSYKEITKELHNTKMIIAGHLHKGYPTAQVNGVTIINQWNFTRLARDYYTLTGQHIPQATIIDTDDIHNPLTIDLVCKGYSEAFIEKALKAELELQANIQDFVDSCKNITLESDSVLNNVPDAIKSRVEFYLNKAEQEIAVGS